VVPGPKGQTRWRIGQTVNGTPAEFPKSAHLLKHADFQRVYQNGKRHFSGNMTVFFLAQDSASGAKGPRVGFTVGRVLGNSVVRNRIRRRTREAVRIHWATLAALPVDIVINPKRSVLQVDHGELRKEIEAAFAVILQRLSRKKSETSQAIGSV
jgi:ribonuclease P protein component